MKRLCYGTYATVLLKCCFKKKVQGALHTALMSPFDPRSPEELARQASVLFRCIEKQSGHIKGEIGRADPSLIRNNIASVIAGFINPNMLDSAIAAIRAIIIEDAKIPDKNTVDQFSDLSKHDLSDPREIDTFDFLAGTFIYAVVNADNDEGSDCIGRITEDFVIQASKDFLESGFTATLDKTNRKPSTEKDYPESDSDDLEAIILEASKSKYSDFITSKDINVKTELLPQIVPDGSAGISGRYTTLATAALESQLAEPMILLCGEGGSGKTYLLFDCYRALLGSGKELPIYVPMSQLSRSDNSPILHYVFDHYFTKLAWGREVNHLKQDLVKFLESTSKPLIFLLDGYNEYAYTAEVSSIKAVDDEILWLRGFPRTRIIMTSRSTRGFDDVNIYRTAKLDTQCVADFLEAHRTTKNIDIWNSSLEKILELLQLPIILTMFVKTYSPGESDKEDTELSRISKHSDILERCINRQLGNLRNHQTVSYTLTALLPLLSDEMDKLKKISLKRREVGAYAYSAVKHTMANGYSDLWWDHDFDKPSIEAHSSDEMSVYRHFIDELLLKNGLLLSEAEGMVSWQHDLLLSWFVAKCIVLRLTFERKSALARMRDIAGSIEESSKDADALFPVALFLYEMLDDNDAEKFSEEYILLLMALARTYRDWRDSPNAYKFATLTLNRADAITPAVPRWRTARIKCLTAYTLLSIDEDEMEEHFCKEDCVNSTERHFIDALAWSRFDITPKDECAAKIVEATANSNMGAFYLAKNKINPDESNLRKALKYHENGLEIKQAAFEEDIDSPEATASIGTSYHCIATDHYELGDYESARDNYLKAIALRKASNTKEIRLVESYVRAIGVLVKLIERNDLKRSLYMEKVALLFQDVLKYSDCLRRNRYEASKLIRHYSDLRCINDMCSAELNNIANQIDQLARYLAEQDKRKAPA